MVISGMSGQFKRTNHTIDIVTATTFVVAALGLAAPAVAQQAQVSAQSGALEEVVVTAQFRNESLQDTPIAISAFTGENLEARGIYSVTDLDQFVPNTVIAPLGAGWGSTMAAFIRGVGLGDNILSFEPGVPIYVDDVYNGRPQGAIFDLLDLERVEILRGPQGTLFGKNAVGGTVRLISRNLKVTARVRSARRSGATTGSMRAASWMSRLIPDKAFARFSFSSKSADGFFKVLDYECVNGAGRSAQADPASRTRTVWCTGRVSGRTVRYRTGLDEGSRNELRSRYAAG